METLLNIGASKEAVIEARKAIMDILETVAEQETKRVALNALTSICKVENANISNCVFQGDVDTKKRKKT